MKKIGIFGGTFDPVHKGHIHLALTCLSELKLSEVKLVPLNIPAHRATPQSTNDHRLAMLELATEQNASLSVDTRELESSEISYTINTLRSLRNDYPNAALYLIMGADAFTYFDTWKDWQEIINYAHIVIANRPDHGTSINKTLEDWRAKTKDNPCQDGVLYGKLYEIQTDMLAISSTEIRKQLAQNMQPDALPASVLDYINSHKLYS